MKYTLLILAAFFSIIIYANINYLHGISGKTLKDDADGCLCHNFNNNDSVTVWIEGPDTVYTSDSADFNIYMTGGPAVVGGFDLAVLNGTLYSVDTLTHLEFNDLTHSFPKLFLNDTVSWAFLYAAPDSITLDTIYSVGNSCNGDSLPINDLDKWNHAENFVINVVDEPVFVQNDVKLPQRFVLNQNYPNPFNPSTKIEYIIQKSGIVLLTVYDVLGNEILTLINEEKPAGTYEVEFAGNDLTSGIYFYSLQIGPFVQTKKMLLLK